ncbi:MAG: class I SAM-dependent methyltransferase [Pseudomonadota bacterium]
MNELDVEKDRLYQDAGLVQFYDIENGLAADWEYCAALAKQAGSVLDIGCGTGGFLTYLTGNKLRCGVDPAKAMLDVARARPGGEQVTWVQADARTVRLPRKYDLVVLTGHAFQVFLTPDDRRAVLATVSSHLTPKGRFIFDTRNPLAEDWRNWIPDETERRIEHPDRGPVTVWNDVSQDAVTEIVTYETHYRIEASGEIFSARSKITFPGQGELAEMMEEAGLDVDHWLGDWGGEPFTSTSPEIIPVGRLKP